MRGKRRPVGERTSSVIGPLPPCKVCGEEGAGFHYGVNTCEACKGFFSRSLLRNEEYECMANGNCLIAPHRRKSCPKCRYQKCLAVGMSRNAIKTGRYTYAKRAKDIQEVRRLTQEGNIPMTVKTPLIVQELTMQADDLKKDDAASYSPPWSPASPNSTFLKTCGISESNSVPTFYQPVETCGIFESNSVHTFYQCRQTLRPIEDIKEEVEEGAEYLIGHEEYNFHSGESFSGNEFDRCCRIIHEEDGQSRKLDQYNSPSVTPDLQKDVTVMPQSGIMSIIISTNSEMPTVTLPPSIVRETSAWPDLFAFRFNHDFKEGELDHMIKDLVTSHRKHIKDLNEFPDEYIEQKIQECLDKCRLKEELFGNMTPIGKNDFDKIYRSTGMDVDGRMKILRYSVKRFEEEIRAIVAFCKTIPEFAMLSLTTQLKLIKDSVMELCLLGFHKGSDADRLVVVEKNRSFCQHEIYSWEGLERHIHYTFQIMKELKSLKLTFEMCVILKTICLFNPQRVEETEYLPIVEKAYDKYVQCLNRLLIIGRQGVEKPFLSAIGSTLQLIQFLYLINRETFHQLNLIEYQPISDSKVILELFD